METSIVYIKDKSDRLMDALSLVLFLLNAALILWGLNFLPDRIPSHINTEQRIDAYGGKYILLGPAIFGALLCSILYYLEGLKGFKPSTFRSQNTPGRYLIDMKTFIRLKPCLAYAFLILTFLMLQTAQHRLLSYTHYFVVLVLLPFPFLFWYWYRQISKAS